MMGGRGPIICKFGVQCHRQDCWYSHPDGRLIDAPGGGSGTTAASRFDNGHISNGVSHGLHIGPVGAGGAMVCWPGMEGGAVQLQPSPRLGGGGGGVVTECRYGFDCKRPGCHFSHPYGRAIDGDVSSMNGGGGVGGGGRPLHSRAPSTSSMGSLVRGMSELSFGSYNPASSTSNDQDLKETWFPKARDCTCCKGYIFGCTADICQSMGQCTCSIEEQDLDGFSLISPKSISRASSPQFETVANGSSPARIAREVARSPPPHTEAAIAAAAAGAAAAAAGGVTFGAARTTAGGGRPSLKRGGSTECRYGTGCKRLDCSFSHPQGRDIDGDGVSFGDFGLVGAGGREESRKSMVDQDLMDTWYPDCRDCPCCKGFKHGCKTPACGEAGICSCSTASNGQAGAHINGSSNPPSAASAPPDASASGSKNAAEEEHVAAGNVVEEATVDGGGDAGNQLAEAVAAA